MSTNIIDEIYFCPCTFGVYFKIPVKGKSSFPSIYKFGTVFYLVNRVLLTYCFDVTNSLLTITGPT